MGNLGLGHEKSRVTKIYDQIQTYSSKYEGQVRHNERK